MILTLKYLLETGHTWLRNHTAAPQLTLEHYVSLKFPSVGLFMTLIYSALFIYGFRYITSYTPKNQTKDNPFGDKPDKDTDKEIFWWFRYYIGKSLYKSRFEIILKPLFMCAYCMSSIYGTLFYFSQYNNLLLWPVFCICLCGLISVIEKISG